MLSLLAFAHMLVFSLPLKWAPFTKKAVVVIFKKKIVPFGKHNISPSDDSQAVVVRHGLYSSHCAGHWHYTHNSMGPFRLLKIIHSSQLRMVKKYQGIDIYLFYRNEVLWVVFSDHVTQNGHFRLPESILSCSWGWTIESHNRAAQRAWKTRSWGVSAFTMLNTSSLQAAHLAVLGLLIPKGACKNPPMSFSCLFQSERWDYFTVVIIESSFRC